MSVSFWVLAAWPATLSPDSIETLNQARSGEWSNGHAVTYTLFVWMTSLGGNFLPLTAAIQSVLVLSAIFGVVRLFTEGCRAALYISAVLFLLPPLGGFAVTIWKDVPFSACVTLGAIALIRAARGSERKYWLVALVILGVGGSFRLNGFLVLVCIGIIAFLGFLWARSARLASCALATFALAALASVALLNFVSTASSAKQAPGWLSWIPAAADLAYLASTDPNRASPEVAALVAKYSTGDSLAGAGDCSSVNGLVFAEGFNGDEVARLGPEIVAAAFDLALEQPDLLIALHACRAANFLPPPLSSGPKYEHWIALAVYPNELGLGPPEALRWIRYVAQGMVATWGLTVKWSVWPGLLALVALVAMTGPLRRRQDGAAVNVLVLGAVCVGTLVAVAPWSVAQDSRYAYTVVIISYSVVAPVILAGLRRVRVRLTSGIGAP